MMSSTSFGSSLGRTLSPVRETVPEEPTAFAPPTQDGLASLAANDSVARHPSSNSPLQRGTLADRLAHPLDYTMMRNTNNFAYEAFGSYSECA